MLTVIKAILSSLAMSYLKRNAAHLLVDVMLEAADKGASLTKTDWDDKEAAKLRANREHYESIIKGQIEHLF